jgi:hypothetical protein
MIMRRVGKSASIRALAASSTSLNGKAGRKSPSGSCSRPSKSPLIPAKASTWSYQGSRSSYRIGQSTPWPSCRFERKSCGDQR